MRENPAKMDDLGVPLFMETPISNNSFWHIYKILQRHFCAILLRLFFFSISSWRGQRWPPALEALLNFCYAHGARFLVCVSSECWHWEKSVVVGELVEFIEWNEEKSQDSWCSLLPYICSSWICTMTAMTAINVLLIPSMTVVSSWRVSKPKMWKKTTWKNWFPTNGCSRFGTLKQQIKKYDEVW